MTIMPPGTLSFLYNVMNDTEMNNNFRDDPYEVMEFFQLTTEQQQFIQKVGTDILKARLAKIAELEIKKATAQPAQATALVAKNAQDLATAFFEGQKRIEQTVLPDAIQAIVDALYAQSYYSEDFKTFILSPIEQELRRGHSRFW
jgi:hypothetical protein